MKKIKLVVLLVVVMAATFYSCSDSSPIENEVVATKSISLRTTLNAIKRANNLSGKTTNDQAPCFDFVYPLTLSYNNGTVVTASTYEGLIEILTNETNDLFIEGIVFPFAIQQEGTVTTINNEEEFYTMIQGCSFNTINDDVIQFDCFQFNFPISVVNQNGESIEVLSQNQLETLLTNEYILDLVFPLSVTQNNQTVVVNNMYELLDLFNQCQQVVNPCDCPVGGTPVCVQTPNGIIEFENVCHAECAGFTTADIVDCGITNPCNCPTDVNPVCVMTPIGIVQYNNACLAECDGYTATDFVDCSTSSQTFGNLLGSCFTIFYPINIQYQGALVPVNSNDELLQYWFPTQASIPAFSYPIMVSFAGDNTVYTFANQTALEEAIAAHCN